MINPRDVKGLPMGFVLGGGINADSVWPTREIALETFITDLARVIKQFPGQPYLWRRLPEMCVDKDFETNSFQYLCRARIIVMPGEPVNFSLPATEETPK